LPNVRFLKEGEMPRDLFEAMMQGWARLNPTQRERFFQAGLSTNEGGLPLTDLSASGIALDYVGVAVKKEKAMGMDILGRDWNFRCSATFWEECLSLAEAFGWERAATVAPATCHQGNRHDSWDGNYRTNDYQQVTDDDARAFAWAQASDRRRHEGTVSQCRADQNNQDL
jgi:hypothetical protein